MFSTVQLTLSRVKGQEQSGRESWTTRSFARTGEATIRTASAARIATRLRDLDFMDGPPYQCDSIVMARDVKIHIKIPPAGVRPGQDTASLSVCPGLPVVVFSHAAIR